MSEGDRWVDLVREGVDCVLRFGDCRTAIWSRAGRDAGPDHLRRAGLSGRLRRARNLMTLQPSRRVPAIHDHGRLAPFDFLVGHGVGTHGHGSATVGDRPRELSHGVRLGLGLAQVPVFHIEQDLAEGRLVRVLADYAFRYLLGPGFGAVSEPPASIPARAAVHQLDRAPVFAFGRKRQMVKAGTDCRLY